MEQITLADARIYLYSGVMGVFRRFYLDTSLDFGEYCAVCKGSSGEEWMDNDAMKRCTLEILEKQKENPDYLKGIARSFEKKQGLYLDFVDSFKSLDLRELTNEELMGYYGTFLDLYHGQFSPPVLPLIYKEHLSEMLYERLKREFGDDSVDMLSCLTTCRKDSFSYEQRKSMLEMMCRMYDELGKELFEKEPEEILAILKNEYPAGYEEIAQHSRKYFWINNNYRRVLVLGSLEFITKMKDESVLFSHPSEELEIMESTKETALEKKERFLGMLDDEEKVMAYLLAEGAWLQDDRKKNNLIGDHVLMEFLDEVSRRTDLEKDILLNAVVYELPDVLNGKADIETLKKRYGSYFSFYINYSGKHRMFGWELGRRYEKSGAEDIREFRGTPASLGKIEAEAIVITKEEDFPNMKKGAILVSFMTRPEYVPVMRKAAGIITDEGGLTCHAAVVSREFRIPCIVGTRIATKVLKDGDRVELDASKGIVRII